MGNDFKQVARFARLRDKITEMVERDQWSAEAVANQLQLINDNPPLIPGRSVYVPGSELAISLCDCTQFVQKFGGIAGIDCSQWVTREAPKGNYWPIPDAGWTYAELLPLVARVPHFKWVPNQIKALDSMQDGRGPNFGEKQRGRILWTPAGVEARQACPGLVGVSYRRLWQMKDEVISAREAIILWLFIYWKLGVMLDQRGWTRTCSRFVDSNDGRGVNVDSSGQGLDVHFSNPGSTVPSGGSRSVILG